MKVLGQIVGLLSMAYKACAHSEAFEGVPKICRRSRYKLAEPGSVSFILSQKSRKTRFWKRRKKVQSFACPDLARAAAFKPAFKTYAVDIRVRFPPGTVCNFMRDVFYF